jgi:hypothetical protein
MLALKNERHERENPAFALLSARRMKTMYLTATTSRIAQMMSDSTPYTFAGDGESPYSELKHSRSA